MTRFAAAVRSALRNASIACLSLVFACGAAEVAVRLLAPQQLIINRPDIWEPRDTLGWENRANVNTTVNTGERTVHLRTDNEGFRIGISGAVRADTRILLMGDSFVEALQVEYEQSLAGLLETDLTHRLGRPIAVRDAGVAGWDPPQYLYRTQELLRRGRYQLVVVALYVGNDPVLRRFHLPPLQASPVKHFRLPRRFSWSELVDALFAPVNDFLKARSHLYVLMKNGTQMIRLQVGLAPPYNPEGFLRSDATSPRWTVTTAICADLASAAAAVKTPVLFVLLPTPFQVDTTIIVEQRRIYHIRPDAIDLEQPTRLLSDSLRQRGLTVIDALPALRLAQAAGGLLYGRVDHHFTPQGHRVVAELLAPILAQYLAERSPRRASSIPRRKAQGASASQMNHLPGAFRSPARP